MFSLGRCAPPESVFQSRGLGTLPRKFLWKSVERRCKRSCANSMTTVMSGCIIVRGQVSKSEIVTNSGDRFIESSHESIQGPSGDQVASTELYFSKSDMVCHCACISRISDM